ncbi:class I SAM-dependent methyltransferase [Halanaerobium hydrogeniformans]|uniref:Methyltransferase type 12 n=1 Tax=Halanaerobium hydrogeniformans TaxID=656519 RepID=E4RPE4_HALHG|nr:class I SAM-dependent methyltransferase [Halanaerobium hydrogeniformans]ADQ13829.1 Methyltransferase type 12 [Halanaerobium hydrogeniformans]
MECIVCESKKLKVLNLKNKYYFCKNCELIFIDRENIIAADEEKERYLGHDNTHQNEGYVRMFEEFIEVVIDPHLENKGRVLEFGCGPGPVLADLLAEKGFRVDKYDPYFYPELEFEEEKYDLITSTEVFEHFSDPCKEIDLLNNLLKVGGYLAVMTSFHPGPEEFSDWWYSWDPTHIVFYNLKTFQKLIEDYNFEIIFCDQEKYILFKKTA